MRELRDGECEDEVEEDLDVDLAAHPRADASDGGKLGFAHAAGSAGT
jgi:hypothetical protein